MKNNNKNDSTQAESDFQIRWQEGSSSSSESISVESLMRGQNTLPSRLRNATASLYTDTTYIEVSDLEWSDNTTLSFTPFRIGFSSTISSSASIRYGYGQDSLIQSPGVGNILFMLPGKEIHAEISPGRLCTVTCSFDQAYAESIMGAIDQMTPLKMQKALELRSPLISAILLRLMQEAVYSGPLSHTVAETLGQAILVECAHWLRSEGTVAQPKALITAHHFEIIDRYLSDLSGKTPSVVALASACGFSERYFAKLFRAQTGLPISQYIKSVRISKAKALLLESDLSLKEIAFRLGYSSAANFSSSFSAAVGQAPGRFRSAD